MKPKIAVLYHFYYPNDVVSARIFQDLCEGLTSYYDVEVWPSNRNYSNPYLSYEEEETLNDVHIRRVWRPALSQSSGLGRMMNSLWMISAWSLRWIFHSSKRPQTVLIGTDPVLAVLTAIVMRLIEPRVKIVHWCFDLYPEAAIAHQKIKGNGFLHRLFSALAGKAYRACNSIIDLGSCMRARLEKYPTSATHETLTPWAIHEPAKVPAVDLHSRRALFGDTKLAILYSGTFGLAHCLDETIQLAENLKNEKINFSFGVRGHAEKILREKCAQAQSLIHFVDFAEDDEWEKRLEAADIHIVSLKKDWTGTVVPSKFFAALAVGRPVIFEGDENSAIAGWIKQYGLGWVLNSENRQNIARDVCRLAQNPAELQSLQNRCFDVYHQLFSRQVALNRWRNLLR